MEPFSALLALCAGNWPVSGEFPSQRPVTRSFDAFFDLRPNKRLSEQLLGWWFETQSCSLWRHRNDQTKLTVKKQHGWARAKRLERCPKFFNRSRLKRKENSHYNSKKISTVGFGNQQFKYYCFTELFIRNSYEVSSVSLLRKNELCETIINAVGHQCGRWYVVNKAWHMHPLVTTNIRQFNIRRLLRFGPVRYLQTSYISAPHH